MSRTKQVTTTKIKEWHALNEHLKEETQRLVCDFQKHFGKRCELSTITEKILSLHCEVEQYLLPPKPRDTRFDDVFQHAFSPSVCAFCGSGATNQWSITYQYMPLKFATCDKCHRECSIDNLEPILVALQKIIQPQQQV
jgi:hypothetical protein